MQLARLATCIAKQLHSVLAQKENKRWCLRGGYSCIAYLSPCKDAPPCLISSDTSRRNRSEEANWMTRMVLEAEKYTQIRQPKDKIGRCCKDVQKKE
jgi:hypothetical protein